MALIKCPECGKMFSEYAEYCPECGFPADAAKASNKAVSSRKTEKVVETNLTQPQLLQQPFPSTSTVVQNSHKNRTAYIVLGIVCVCAIGIGLFFFLGGKNVLSHTANQEVIDTTEVTTIPSTRKIYKNVENLSKCFIVISKRNLSLKVYEALTNDTVLIAVFPVCLGKNIGPKQGEGDKKTPETTMDNPFVVTQFQDASSWRHDFGDGRGPVKSFGKWFARLRTGFDGLGIYGCNYYEEEVPGRESEGSVRLKLNDFTYLYENYLYEGMKVVIKKENEGLFPFEITAHKG